MTNGASSARGAARPRVLVVDDEAGIRELLDIVLTADGYSVTLAEDIEAAQKQLAATQFDCVLTDLRIGLDREAGMRLLNWMRKNHPAVPSVMMTAYGSVETAIEAMKRGAADYIMKPFQNDEVRLRVRLAIEKRNLVRENVALRKAQAMRGGLDDIVGASDAIEEVRDMIRRLATLSSTIAIHGESGAGKELVARGLHQLSDRRDRPFIAVNCGAFPENLLESELFGHRRGAFTGAVDDKEGLFVVANGGTMFLDEIGEMPLSLQVKLLRVLDNGIIQPVGGVSGIPVDVRIISATNRNIEQMTREGAFREDLYYRLNVIPITVPPLRARKDDIPLLANRFIADHARKMGRAVPELSREALDRLIAFNWPGNVRELENALERAVALCRGETIQLDDLPPQIRYYARTAAHPVPAKTAYPAALPEEGIDLESHVADIEVALLEQALQRAKYSQKRAANLLGLTARSLRYRLQKHGLDT